MVPRPVQGLRPAVSRSTVSAPTHVILVAWFMMPRTQLTSALPAGPRRLFLAAPRLSALPLPRLSLRPVPLSPTSRTWLPTAAR